ncbi:hypothetical protein DPMN_190943 [Dreissena polymorpha]|uniref:Uncharacterized protein n=1 Tax=Dreissena polymorpha TaxID=45954 RepID=A0A9D4BDX7_DREPO|nr:hypothetical protein DPMN_190943 [Dreissena polymorpha]
MFSSSTSRYCGYHHCSETAATHSTPPVLRLFISLGTAANTTQTVPRLLTQLSVTAATHSIPPVLRLLNSLGTAATQLPRYCGYSTPSVLRLLNSIGTADTQLRLHLTPPVLQILNSPGTAAINSLGTAATHNFPGTADTQLRRYYGHT